MSLIYFVSYGLAIIW